MGYDLYGKNSDSKTGSYFRTNVWGWSNFRKLMAAGCQLEIDEGRCPPWADKDWDAISSNNGNFVGKIRCLKMAKVLRKQFEERPPVDPAEIVVQALEGVVQFKKDLPGFEKWDEIKERDEYVNKYILFLETCGGFSCC